MNYAFRSTADVRSSPVVDVGVLGNINLDTIENADGRTRVGFGGALFTACALAHLAGATARIWLLARVAAELEERLRQQLRHVPALRLEGLLPMTGPGYRCHIRYDDSGDKTEVLSGHAQPLTSQELSEFLPNLQALVVNFITGDEIDRPNLAAIRRQISGPVFMDVHSLTLGRMADGRRFPRPLANVGGWLMQADVVQMNQLEARILGAPADDDNALIHWAQQRLDLGPAAIVVTRGDAGAVAVWRSPGGQVESLTQQAHPVPGDGQLDPTGCGDVFLAGLAAAHVRGLDMPAAVCLASAAAAQNCQFNTLDELDRLAS